ncbi:MAG: 4Fe-4S dicluster domain-containing protein [Desulfobacteraceae bacterium]
MSKAIFIDTTLCTACRACQVACKQWHNLPAEKTVNRGSYQNPEDLSFSTYKLVRMNEEIIDNKLHWLFFPDQCRHCREAPCLDTAYDERAIYKDHLTGAIVYTAQTKELNADDIIDSCPYNIPKRAADNTLAKCDMCNDRVHNGLKPACVQTCPTGAMDFGERKEMVAKAEKRVKEVQATHPGATLLDPYEVNVIYLVSQSPRLYWEFAMAQPGKGGLKRGVALRKMAGPLAKLLKV